MRQDLLFVASSVVGAQVRQHGMHKSGALVSDAFDLAELVLAEGDRREEKAHLDAKAKDERARKALEAPAVEPVGTATSGTITGGNSPTPDAPPSAPPAPTEASKQKKSNKP